MTVVQLLMERDGLDELEAFEIAQDIHARVVSGVNVNDALAEFGIDYRELGLKPVNFGL